MPIDPITAIGPTIGVIKETVNLFLELQAVDTQAMAMLKESISIEQEIRHVQHLREDAGTYLSAVDREWVAVNVEAAQDAFNDVGKIIRPLYADLVSRGSVALGRRFEFVLSKDEIRPLLSTVIDAKSSLLATLPALNDACARKRAEEERRNGTGNTIEIEHLTWTSAEGASWIAQHPSAFSPSTSGVGMKKPKHRPSLSRSGLSTGVLYPPPATSGVISREHEPLRSSKLHTDLPKQDPSSALAVYGTSSRLLAQASSPDLRRANEAVASTIDFASRIDLTPPIADDVFGQSLHLPYNYHDAVDATLPTYDEAIAQTQAYPPLPSRVTSFSRTRMSVNYGSASSSRPAAISEGPSRGSSQHAAPEQTTTPAGSVKLRGPGTPRKLVPESSVLPVGRAELGDGLLSPLDSPPQTTSFEHGGIPLKRPKQRFNPQGPS